MQVQKKRKHRPSNRICHKKRSIINAKVDGIPRKVIGETLVKVRVLGKELAPFQIKHLELKVEALVADAMNMLEE